MLNGKTKANKKQKKNLFVHIIIARISEKSKNPLLPLLWCIMSNINFYFHKCYTQHLPFLFLSSSLLFNLFSLSFFLSFCLFQHFQCSFSRFLLFLDLYKFILHHFQSAFPIHNLNTCVQREKRESEDTPLLWLYVYDHTNDDWL